MEGKWSEGIRSGSRVVSMEQVSRRARRVAGGLRDFGIDEGDCVAILMRNDIPYLEISYGAMFLGAYTVPINWHLKSEEVEYILRDCGARVLFGHADLINTVAAGIPDDVFIISCETPEEILLAYGVPAERTLLPNRAVEYEAWLTGKQALEGPGRPAPVSMLYTSGTTGHPKGVRRVAPTPEEERLTNNLRSTVYGLKAGVRALVPGPLYHSAPNSFGLRSGKIGECVVLMPRFDPEEFLALVERESIDTVFMVPTMFTRLLKLPEEVRRKYDVSSLKHIIHAAAPCPPDVKTAMIEWWGPVIWEFYGGTETGPVTWISSEEALRKPGAAGRPCEGAIIRILDEEKRDVPQGEVGEIFSRIPYYPDFIYHNLEEQRAEVGFEGLVTLGDMGFIDEDGYLFVCDRKRDMVISGGVNIYPAEIEAVLHNVPGIKDCAVFGIPDADFGEKLAAAVEPLDGVKLDPVEVRSCLVLHLADYKIPKVIEISHSLPRDDAGKIFKRLLRAPYWEGSGRRI